MTLGENYVSSSRTLISYHNIDAYQQNFKTAFENDFTIGDLS